jgi:repressor LexA
VTTLPAAVTRDLIVRFVGAHVAEHGYPPSVREIGAVLGLASSSTVQHHIDVLVKEGRLRRRPGTSRTLSVAPTAKEAP